MHIPETKVGRFMVGVGCVMEYEPTGEILCLKRDRSNYRHGEWELMYGRIDQHEELFSALRREVDEETGLRGFEIGRLLRVWHLYRGEKNTENEIFGFTFHCKTSDQSVRLSSEHSEFQWVKPERAIELIASEGIRADVQFFIDQKNERQIAFSGFSDKIEHIL